jgi:hypothetical protein
MRLLRKKAIISITKDIEQDEQNLPLQSIVHIVPVFQQLHARS